MAQTAQKPTETVGYQQPVVYYAVMDGKKGIFRQVPNMPELSTVAEVYGVDAANKLLSQIVRAYGAGWTDSDRTRSTLFDRKLDENGAVRGYIAEKLKAAGRTTSDAEIDAALAVPENRVKLIAQFGAQVAGAGYTPKKKGAKGTATETTAHVL